MYYISKRLEIAGSHRLNLPYESPCRNLHGHNWIITIHCKAQQLNPEGMICDFKQIKEKIQKTLDHKYLNELLDFNFNPTAENIAHWCCEQIPQAYKVEVQESEGNIAIYEDETV